MMVNRYMLAAVLLLLPLSSCGRLRAARITGGDPHAGATKARRYGCAGCHAIPGISGSDGMVAPSLSQIGSRKSIAGGVPNTPANMIKWIQHPRSLSPRTNMPDMGVPEQDSRDIAAFLYTLN